MNTNHLWIGVFAFLAGICFAALWSLLLVLWIRLAKPLAGNTAVARQRHVEREARQRQGLETREIVQTRTGRVSVEFCHEHGCTRCDTPSPQGHAVAPTSVQYLSARREFLRMALPVVRDVKFERYCNANRFGPRGISDDTQ